MGDIPAGPPGFTRFLMKSKFGAGRDFAVLDPNTEAQLYFVDGKVGPRPKAEVQAGDGSVDLQRAGTPARHPEEDGDHRRLRHRGPVAEVEEVHDRQGQDDDGDGQRRALAAHRPVHRENYTVTSGGRDIVRISQKWVTPGRTSTPWTSPTEPTLVWPSRSSGPLIAGSSGTDDEPSPGTRVPGAGPGVGLGLPPSAAGRAGPESVEVWLGERAHRRIRPLAAGAETSHPPTYYLPVDDFAPGALRATEGASWCEFKGGATYFDVHGGGWRRAACRVDLPPTPPRFRAHRRATSP